MPTRKRELRTPRGAGRGRADSASCPYRVHAHAAVCAPEAAAPLSPCGRRGALDTCARNRPDLKSACGDCSAASLAGSVRTGFQPAQSGIELQGVQLRLSDEGADLRSFERNRCPFRIMLVIGIAATRGRHHRVVVLDEVRQPVACLCTLGLKSSARSLHVPNLCASHKL